ncbi:ryanodine receptor 2-like [Sinocyclocheilus grahami]|uniref:ryanodine receptor 2-like n=1 Tax=Sinocyclocheilus grahami TaxID=75366 RepID=UPI0007AD5559|nr:PREDICTED: ryanodine receptor 2-like [Sinocyclocheilus grahami]
MQKLSSSKPDETEIQDSAVWKMICSQKTKLLNSFVRNFYNMRLLALFLTLAINFILLFYKVSSTIDDDEEVEITVCDDSTKGSQEVYFELEENSGYMKMILHSLAVLHTLISLGCIIGYYCLKVMTKYRELYGSACVSELLGLDKAALDFSSEAQESKRPVQKVALFRLNTVDVKYQIWKLGVVFTDNSFLYLTWCMFVSVLGHYNNVFFVAHLLDIAMGFKTLRTILSSVTHNGKQY